MKSVSYEASSNDKPEVDKFHMWEKSSQRIMECPMLSLLEKMKNFMEHLNHFFCTNCCSLSQLVLKDNMKSIPLKKMQMLSLEVDKFHLWEIFTNDNRMPNAFYTRRNGELNTWIIATNCCSPSQLVLAWTTTQKIVTKQFPNLLPLPKLKRRKWSPLCVYIYTFIYSFFSQ